MLSQAYLLNIFKKNRGQKNSVSEKNSRAFLIRKLNASGFFEVLPNKLYAPEFFDAFFTEEANFSKESKEFLKKNSRIFQKTQCSKLVDKMSALLKIHKVEQPFAFGY